MLHGVFGIFAQSGGPQRRDVGELFGAALGLFEPVGAVFAQGFEGLLIAGLVIGLPLCMLVNRAFRHVLNQWVHVLAYAMVGMLYGLVVLAQGVGGVLPMLIPVIGFPAAVLMGLGRLAARPLVDVVPGAEPRS